MRRILLFAVCLLGSAQVFAQTTPTPIPITGNLGAIQGTGQPYAGVSIQLQNCASPISITGYFGIVQTGYQIRATSSGLITGTVWPNDLINCNGTTGNSQYNVAMIVAGVPSGTPQCYQVTVAQTIWNMNTQQPIPCSQSPPNPQDAQFRNLNVTGCFSVDGGACGGGGGGGGGTPGGTNGQIQYNNNGAFAGIPGDYGVSGGSNIVTLSGVGITTTIGPTLPPSPIFSYPGHQTFAGETVFCGISQIPGDNGDPGPTTICNSQAAQFWEVMRNNYGSPGCCGINAVSGGWETQNAFNMGVSAYSPTVLCVYCGSANDFHDGDFQFVSLIWQGANICQQGSCEGNQPWRSQFQEVNNWSATANSACVGCRSGTFPAGGITFNAFQLGTEMVDQTAAVTGAITAVAGGTINAGIGSSSGVSSATVSGITVSSSINGVLLRTVDPQPIIPNTTGQVSQQVVNLTVSMPSNPNGLICKLSNNQFIDQFGAPTGAGGVIATTGVISTGTIGSGGSGYTSQDIGAAVNIIKAGSNGLGQVVIGNVSGGAVTAVYFVPSGGGYTTGSSLPTTTTGVHGSGLTVNITGLLANAYNLNTSLPNSHLGGAPSTITIQSGGTGFTSGDIGKGFYILESGSTGFASGAITAVAGGAVTGVSISGNSNAYNYALANGLSVVANGVAFVGSGLLVNVTALTGSFLACGGAVGNIVEQNIYGFGVAAQYYHYPTEVISSTSPSTLVLANIEQQGTLSGAPVAVGPITMYPAAQVFGVINQTNGQPDAGHLYWSANNFNDTCSGSCHTYLDMHATGANYYGLFLDQTYSNPTAVREDISINETGPGGGISGDYIQIAVRGTGPGAYIGGGGGSPFNAPVAMAFEGGHAAGLFMPYMPQAGSVEQDSDGGSGCFLCAPSLVPGATSAVFYSGPETRWVLTPDAYGAATFPLFDMTNSYAGGMVLQTTGILTRAGNNTGRSVLTTCGIYPFTDTCMGDTFTTAGTFPNQNFNTGGLGISTAPSPPDAATSCLRWFATDPGSPTSSVCEPSASHLSTTATFAASSGTNTIYRCTTAGTLPIGALTITTADCTASVDTGFRSN